MLAYSHARSGALWMHKISEGWPRVKRRRCAEVSFCQLCKHAEPYRTSAALSKYSGYKANERPLRVYLDDNIYDHSDG
jgi:hypothetical protein